MNDQTKKHNEAVLPLLKIVVAAADKESAQWVVLESLCLGIGKLHGRNDREIAEFIEAMAQRIVTGERGQWTGVWVTSPRRRGTV